MAEEENAGEETGAAGGEKAPAGGEKGWVSKAAKDLAKSQGLSWKNLGDEEKKKLRRRAKRSQTAA